jgi:hypothetical protein
MSVRQAQVGGAAAGSAPSSASADARERLVAAVREAVALISREGGGYITKSVIPGVTIVAKSPYGRKVKVVFSDEVVDELLGRLSESTMKWVGAEVLPEGYTAFLGTMVSLPSTWRSPRYFALLSDAFNAAVSALGVGEVLEKELGLRLEARGVSVRRMYRADDLKRRPVVLVDFDVNGKPLTANMFTVSFDPDSGRALLRFEALLRHGDRRLARRLYVLAWLRKEMWEALRKLRDEGKVRDFSGGYDEHGKRYIYKVDLGDRKVVVTHPEGDCARFIKFFDEQCIVYDRTLRIERGKGGEINLVAAAEKWLEDIEQESRRLLASLKRDANRLMGSDDPRERELGHLLAVLIKRAYEEAEMAIPG